MEIKQNERRTTEEKNQVNKTNQEKQKFFYEQKILFMNFNIVFFTNIAYQTIKLHKIMFT